MRPITEEQAIVRLCPMAMSTGLKHGWTNCAGRACMAWIWQEEFDMSVVLTERPGAKSPTPAPVEEGGWFLTKKPDGSTVWALHPRKGWCGMVR